MTNATPEPSPLGLEPPMERALELAWEAYCAGSFPVGCVIADGDGTVVAEGRNRIGDATAPAGRVHATSLAHAEIDALSQLRAGRYGDHVLYTSVEPCLLCRSAAVMSHIGEVRFLAADPTQADRNYNYNDNSVLSNAIRAGARGAYWDILRQLGD